MLEFHLRPAAVLASFAVLSQLALGLPSFVQGAPVTNKVVRLQDWALVSTNAGWPILKAKNQSVVLQDVANGETASESKLPDAIPAVLRVARQAGGSPFMDFGHPMTMTQLTQVFLLETPSRARELLSDSGIHWGDIQELCGSLTESNSLEVARLLLHTADMSPNLVRAVSASSASDTNQWSGSSDTQNVTTQNVTDTMSRALRVVAGACVLSYLESTPTQNG